MGLIGIKRPNCSGFTGKWGTLTDWRAELIILVRFAGLQAEGVLERAAVIASRFPLPRSERRQSQQLNPSGRGEIVTEESRLRPV
jgi:hypothetical protein